MKILVLSTRVPHAHVKSGHIIVHQRIRGLLERGHQVGLATFAKQEDRHLLDNLRNDLVDVVWRPDPSEEPPHGVLYEKVRRPQAYRQMVDPAFYRMVGDIVEQSRYDIAVAEYSVMGPYLYANPYMPSVRRVLSIHQSLLLNCEKKLQQHTFSCGGLRARLLRPLLNRYEKRLLGSMDRVFVLTTQEQYGLRYRHPDLKLQVVPCGVDTEHFHPARRSEGPPQLLFTGDFSDAAHHNGACWFLKRVWPHLHAAYPDLTFQIMGPNVSSRMKELARRHSGVTMPGGVDDVRPWLQSATMFVCPLPVGSGLRVKLLEAMAAGLPVVGTTPSFEGLPTRIGETCFMADTPDLLRIHIEALLDDKDLRERMALEARKMIVERFSLAGTLDLYEHELLDILRKG